MSFHRSSYDAAPRKVRRSIATQSRRYARLASYAFNAGDTESHGILALVAFEAAARRNGEQF